MPTAKARTRVTVPLIASLKACDRKITALTAYDYTMARLIDRAEADLILVGDSLACVVKGEPTTLTVSMEEMIYHTRCVARGVEYALVVADLPFLSYQVSLAEAVQNAGRLLQAGAAAVKLEGGVFMAETIARLVQVDIPVVGHVGLTPQSYHRMGGHKLQGRSSSTNNSDAGSAARILADALAVEEAGAFAIVLEGIPAELAATISARLKIPTIGIAAGSACDGQIIVSTDLLGLNPEHCPNFVQPRAHLAEEVMRTVQEFKQAVDQQGSCDQTNARKEANYV